MKSSTLLFCAFAIAAVKAQSSLFFTTNNACAGAPDMVAVAPPNSNASSCAQLNGYCAPSSSNSSLSLRCDTQSATTLNSYLGETFQGNRYIGFSFYNDTKCAVFGGAYVFKAPSGSKSVCVGMSPNFMSARQNKDQSVDFLSCSDSKCSNCTTYISAKSTCGAGGFNGMSVKAVINLTPAVNSTKKEGETVSDSSYCASIQQKKLLGREQHCSQLNLLTKCISSSTSVVVERCDYGCDYAKDVCKSAPSAIGKVIKYDSCAAYSSLRLDTFCSGSNIVQCNGKAKTANVTATCAHGCKQFKGIKPTSSSFNGNVAHCLSF